MDDRTHPPAPQPLAPAPLDAVGLHDCDAEPIHVPGHVQSHGAMVALDTDLRVRNWSVNIEAMLGHAPVLLQPLQALPWPPALKDAAREARDEGADGLLATLRAVDGDPWPGFDVLVHAHGGRVIVEFERAVAGGDAGAGAMLARAHRVIDGLRRPRELSALLDTVATQVRSLTGFDRVMVYRFRHDDSGDVAAEARRDDLEALLGMRYPASDIPAQARRLYVLSTLRLIADVGQAPVPVLGHPDDPPLDMSHAALRSVSPIHVEYLRNMGVQASMSISIVVDGRLWGLVACHHYAPLRPSHAVRSVCDLLAQVLAAQVARLDSGQRAAAATRAAQLREKLGAELQHHDDLLAGCTPQLAALAQMFEADALVVTHGGRYVAHGDIDGAVAKALLGSLPADGDLLERDSRAAWPDGIGAAIGPWVGLLGVCFDPAGLGWVLALRAEQEHTVRWGGAPEKRYVSGPRGPRLTPRGSFAEWRETVRGEAAPWTPELRTAARHLQSDLQRETLARHADVERARTQMLAMVSHDLRDPLNSIRMAAGLLERGTTGDTQQRIGARIRSSSGRMERLVAHLLDFTRIRNGRGLEVSPVAGDLVPLLADLVDETRTAHPGWTLELDLPDTLPARFDPDRVAQAVGNLLSNARHHGDPLLPVWLRARQADGSGVTIEVRNPAPALPPELTSHLFTAFKRTGLGQAQAGRHRGLGLGLFIAHHIGTEHGGTLDYRHDAGDVVFTLRLPG